MLLYIYIKFNIIVLSLNPITILSFNFSILTCCIFSVSESPPLEQNTISIFFPFFSICSKSYEIFSLELSQRLLPKTTLNPYFSNLSFAFKTSSIFSSSTLSEKDTTYILYLLSLFLLLVLVLLFLLLFIIISYSYLLYYLVFSWLHCWE